MIFREALVWPTSRCDLRISLSTVRSSILLQSFVAAADLVVASLLSCNEKPFCYAFNRYCH
jgi:hypothetical protein